MAGVNSRVRTPRIAPRSGMFNQGVRTTELASDGLLDAVRAKGRTIKIAQEGSEELRYLDFMRANANVGGDDLTHILLPRNPTKVEVLEEFLHGTQKRLGIVERLGIDGAERHVKDFMIRHQRLAGIADEDVRILVIMLGG